LPTEDFVTADSVNASLSPTNDLHPTTGEGIWALGTDFNAPVNTFLSSAVWTGTEMIIWGGAGALSTGDRNTGARYNPLNDSWIATTTNGAPVARNSHASIWTGTEMLVWGGMAPGTNPRNDGGLYNPATNSWRPISTIGAPPPAYNFALLWTGKEALVWGFESQAGGRYDPRMDTWRPITTTGAPVQQGALALAAAWTGKEMLVFYACYGFDTGECHPGGGRYDPDTDTWRPMSMIGAPRLGVQPAVVWTGQDLIVYGGGDWLMLTIQNFNMGGRYNPRTDTWQTVPVSPFFGSTVVLDGLWTGGDVIFIGVENGGTRVAAFDVIANQWQSIPNPPCQFDTPIWTGKEIMLWGADISGCAQPNAPLPVLRYMPPHQTSHTLLADADTFIAQGQPSAAFGSEQLLWAGYDPQFKYYTERVLTHFPLTIPTRATVTQAAALLYLYGYSNGAAPMNMTAYRVTAPWNEGSTWQTAGNSYNTALGSTISVGTAFGWYGWDVTNIVKTWQSGTPNYGLMFNGNESGARNERVFIAREAGTTGTAYLSVTYTDPAYAPDTTAPTASLAGLPMLQPEAIPLAVRWLGSDVGRGIQSFDVQVSDNGGAWPDWYTWAVGTTGTFSGESGHTYCFRVRSRDYAGNVGSWSTPSRCTTFYADVLIGQVVDQRHAPVVGSTLTITPNPIAMQLDSLSGQYVAYLTNSQPHQVSIGHLDYALPPTATVDVSTTDRYDIILQPLDNLIQNANFELPLATGWITSGTLPIASSTYRHSGDFAVALNSEAVTTDGLATLTQAVTLPVDARPQILSFMYALSTTAPLSQSGFSVTVEFSGTTTSVFTTTTPCLDWCHQWIDLSAWQGQSITLTFTLEQNNGEALQVYLDEVTLGVWLTPLVQQVTPVQVDANTTTVITVTGENFLAEPLVLLNGLPVSTTWLSATTLTATVPSTLTFGSYSVQVQNPSNHRGAWSRRLIVGHQIYLPITSKNAP